MSKEGNRENVLHTTKVRTKLRGDGSWLQRRDEPQAEAKEEKPWLAEVRASRVNGAPSETSPAPSPTKPAPPPAKPDTERAPSSGHLIRGIFTKLDEKSAPSSSSSTSNGLSGATQFNKKASETYKKIAPHTVRSAPESQESQLSTEEQEKRTEAASNVVVKSAARQRSYVLSAAKKFESKEAAPDTSVVNSTTSFVAKRVEVFEEEDESAATPSPVRSPLSPVTSAAPAPLPKPRKIADGRVETAVERDAPPVSAAAKDPFEDMTPGLTEEASPLSPVLVQAVCAAVEPDDSDASEQDDAPLVELTPASPTRVSATAAPPAPAAPVPVTPVLTSTVPESTAPEPSITVRTEPIREPEPEPEPEVEPEPEPEPEVEPEPEPESKLSPKPSSSGDTLSALYGTLVSFDTTSTSVVEDEPEVEEPGWADSFITDRSVAKEPTPVLSNCEPITDDLLSLDDGTEAPAEPVPPSPGRWSQDLLGGLDSETGPETPGGTVDLLSDDVILISSEARSLSMQQQQEEEEEEEERQTDEAAGETQSPTETVTVTTTTVTVTHNSEENNAGPWSSHVTTTVTESSSADPFDPYPIGTTSPNSSSDLLQPLTHIPINSASTTFMENKAPSPEITTSGNGLESLIEDDVNPIDAGSTSLTTKRSWARTWDMDEGQEPEPQGPAEGQETLITFERKSKENDSPWDKWTSPTVYTITTTTGEEEESPEEREMQEVTTITTIREIHTETEPAMDRHETYSSTVVEEDRRVQTPEPDTKKGFVFVKEYVNTTESLYNASDKSDRSDYLTSSSIGYTHSSPSFYSSGSLSSTCNYCGEQVGNDAKITVEHLNINCHPACFKCGVCSKPMGDLLSSMFLHGGKVHCESCYAKAFD